MPPSLSNTGRPEDEYRRRMAEALAEKFTRPVPRMVKGRATDEIADPLPADRVERAMSTVQVMDDGYPSIGMVTCMEAAEVCAAVRDEEIEKLRGKVERLRSNLAHTEETAIKVIAKRTEKAEAEVEKLRADLADANATLTELAPLSLGVRAEKAEAAVARGKALAVRVRHVDPAMADLILGALTGDDSAARAEGHAPLEGRDS